MASIDDSQPAHISPDCPHDTRQVLEHAWNHDWSSLKPLLRTQGRASAQDPTTGETPLHAAIRACGPADDDDSEPEGDDGREEEHATPVVQGLFQNGAIWNDVDCNNETPGCVAHRLGRMALYRECVNAGVRAEMLFALMDGYEKLSSGPEDEDGDEDMQQDSGPQEQETAAVATEPENGDSITETKEAAFVPPDANEKPVTSDEYLQSNLTYDDDKLLDADLNGVMMAWETDIMRRSVDALIPDSAPGKRILNIGFGMGIIDGMFAALKPAKHHIIEAHPAVLAHIAKPDSKFNATWEADGSDNTTNNNNKVHAGRWQDVVPGLVAAGEVYDAIYFDTFGEDWAQLRMFFTEYVPALLDFEGRFGFFNGLGADRRICYDVYAQVVELQASDAGLDVEWEVIDVDMAGLAEPGKGEWEGVRRRYWTLDQYRLPICTFMG